LVSTSRVEAATTLVVATTDKAGRKPLLLICSPGMTLTLEILGGDIRLSFIFVRRLIPETNGVRPRRRWSSRYPAGRHTSPGRHVGVGLSAADGCHAQCSYSMPRRRREELTAQGAQLSRLARDGPQRGARRHRARAYRRSWMVGCTPCCSGGEITVISAARSSELANAIVAR
jgi:hypothetical protein